MQYLRVAVLVSRGLRVESWRQVQPGPGWNRYLTLWCKNKYEAKGLTIADPAQPELSCHPYIHSIFYINATFIISNTCGVLNYLHLFWNWKLRCFRPSDRSSCLILVSNHWLQHNLQKIGETGKKNGGQGPRGGLEEEPSSLSTWLLLPLPGVGRPKLPAETYLWACPTSRQIFTHQWFADVNIQVT